MGNLWIRDEDYFRDRHLSRRARKNRKVPEFVKELLEEGNGNLTNAGNQCTFLGALRNLLRRQLS